MNIREVEDLTGLVRANKMGVGFLRYCVVCSAE